MSAAGAPQPGPSGLRIGIDLGGTKIEGIALEASGVERARRRVVSPQRDYADTIAAVAGLVAALEVDAGRSHGDACVGIGMPGSISPATGLVQNANSTWLNGRPFAADVGAALARPVRLANDANCFAVSEATDGAGAGAGSVLGIILGTGCGGGIVVGGRIVDGPRGIGGEWGHTPLPWAEPAEHPGPVCWCGRRGCMETWVSGPALARDHAEVNAIRRAAAPTAEQIGRAAANGEPAAAATLARHASRLARGLAMVVDILDPDVIVLGGGLSRLGHLYAVLPDLMAPHIFADRASVSVRAPRWGDASGVRGAAWLWGR